jgi:hypothetical protein
MRTVILAFSVACLAVASMGCSQGYRSASDLQDDERGPQHCAQRCQELGMQMGAFVLVEHAIAGCVCEPIRTSGGAAVTHSPGAVTGGVALIMEQQRQAQQQQQAAAAAARR